MIEIDRQIDVDSKVKKRERRDIKRQKEAIENQKGTVDVDSKIKR